MDKTHRHPQKPRRLTRQKGSAVRKRLEHAAPCVGGQAEHEANDDPSHARARSTVTAARAVLQISRDLAAPNALNRANLHEYREKIKQLRHVLQAASKGASEELMNATRQMRKKYLRIPSTRKGRRAIAARFSQEILRAVGGVVE